MTMTETMITFTDAAGGCRGGCSMLEIVAEHEREILLQMHDEFVSWLGSGTLEGFTAAVAEVACASSAVHDRNEYPAGWEIEEFINIHNWPEPVETQRLGYYLGQLYENGREQQWAMDKDRAEKGWALVPPKGDTMPTPFANLRYLLHDHERRLRAVEAPTP